MQDTDDLQVMRAEQQYALALLTLSYAYAGCLDLVAVIRAKRRVGDVMFAANSDDLDNGVAYIALMYGESVPLSKVVVCYTPTGITVRSSRQDADLPTFPLPGYSQDALPSAKAIIACVEQELVRGLC
jgi:hypothetical protein